MLTIIVQVLIKYWFDLLLLLIFLGMGLSLHFKDDSIVKYQQELIDIQQKIANLTTINATLKKNNEDFANNVKQQNVSIDLLNQKGKDLQSKLDSNVIAISQLKIQNSNKIKKIINATIPTTSKDKNVMCQDAMAWGIEEAKGLRSW